MKIVVACDSFKGSLSSRAVIQCLAEAIHSVDATCDVVTVEIADGGEGTLSAIEPFVTAQRMFCQVSDPLGRSVNASYLWLPRHKQAIIELAEASGLTRLCVEERNPLVTTTYGTGELIRDALMHGAQDIVLTVGGSATNDVGCGMLRALGYRFLNEKGEELISGGEILEHIAVIDETNVLPQLKNCSFTLATDVTNPLCGLEGAARIFAQQKGADTKMVERLEQGALQYVNLLNFHFKTESHALIGGGAAGGVGVAALLFLKAKLVSGIDMLLDCIEFDRLIRNTDWIITGEGRLDEQTMMGKAPMGILQRAREQRIPVIALAGKIENWEALNQLGFRALFSIVGGPGSLEEAMCPDNARANLQRTMIQIMRLLTTPIL